MNITIPPEALEAGARASYEDWVSICVTSGGVPEEYRAWDDLEDGERDEWRDHARAACLAMLNAWPGMVQDHGFYFDEADNALIQSLDPLVIKWGDYGCAVQLGKNLYGDGRCCR